MSNQLLALLRKRRSELNDISPSVATWPEITEWHSGTQPIIGQHFRDHVKAFDAIVRVKWTALPRYSSRRENNFAEASAAERAANSKKIQSVRAKLVGQVDALIELINLDVGEAETHETDSVFAEIDRLIAASHLPQQYKTIVASDLADAQSAYRGGAFKGCVVMLGAALEGVMLGTLQRTDVLIHLATEPDPPGPIRTLGNRDPQLADKIGCELAFEDYKACIHDLIPGSASLGVEGIQSFRNAIHPWKSIQEPMKYGSFDRSHALNFVGSLQTIVKAVCQWTP